MSRGVDDWLTAARGFLAALCYIVPLAFIGMTLITILFVWLAWVVVHVTSWMGVPIH